MKFAIVDCNEYPMSPDKGRGRGFVNALAGWEIGTDYEFVRHCDVPTRRGELLNCQGLIMSGSVFDLALPPPGDEFDRSRYQQMIPVFELIRGFQGPVLGICFGHQLMALADEYDSGRTSFGNLRIRNMKIPQDKHTIVQVRMNGPLRFMKQRDLWVQFNHKQEVLLNGGLLQYYEIIAGSDSCPVQIMQHRTRDWYGVQFHPEIGKDSQAGETSRHDDSVTDGQALMQDFVRYCLRPGRVPLSSTTGGAGL
jgi:GMP synthase-like glutamine amidotransferase